MARRWLHSLDVEVDEQRQSLAEKALIALGQAIVDGRVKVDASGITIEADIIDVDIEGLIEGIAGGTTLDDLALALGAPAQQFTPTSGASAGVTVGNGAGGTTVLNADASRTRVVLTNDSNEGIYVSVGGTPVVHQGIYLAASGGGVTLSVEGGCRLAIKAICASGGKTLCVQTLSM